MRKALLCLIPLLLLGCSKQDERDEIARLNARVSQLEAELAAVGGASDRMITELKADLAREQTAHAEADADYRMQLELRGQEIARLGEELNKSYAAIKDLKSPALPPPTPGVDLVVSESPAREAFPLEVSDVRGEKVETGSHVRPIQVPTGEFTKDKYGNRKPVMEWKEETIPEYAYRIAFSVANNRPSRVAFSAQAGEAAEEFAVEAGRKAEFSVPASRGSRLRIETGGRSRSFDAAF